MKICLKILILGLVAMNLNGFKQSKEMDDKVQKFVNEAVDYFYKSGPEKAFHDFSYDKQFDKNWTYIFAYTTEGLCMAHAGTHTFIGKNLKDMTSINGAGILKTKLKAVNNPVHAGWAVYTLKGSIKRNWVVEVKDAIGRTYLIGAGYTVTE